MKTVFINEQRFDQSTWQPFNDRIAELGMVIYKRSEVREIMDTIVKLRQELSFESGRAQGIMEALGFKQNDLSFIDCRQAE